MFCPDPFLTYLKDFGYSVIRLPKADVRPLQILARQGNDLDRLGDLTTVLVGTGSVPVPPISENIAAASISGRRTSDLSIGIGLSILGSVLGAMGGSKLGLELKYQQAKTAAFEFLDVLEDKVEVAKLDHYLADADVNPLSRTVAQLLEADEIYVTTATIKSRKFTVEAKKSNSAGLDVSIPEIQEMVGGNVKVSGQSEVTSKVTYEGTIPLVFGFQAVRLYYDDGRYTAFEPLGTGDAGMRALRPPVRVGGAELLTTENPFVRLR